MRRLGAMLTLALAAACADTAVDQQGAAPAPAVDVQTREVTYELDGTMLNGMVAWDANRSEPRPGVLVVHEWWGLDTHIRNQARRLAAEGYVALAVDMYGDGKFAEHPDEAQRFMEEAASDPVGMRARFAAARQVLAADPHVDSDRMAAIGYCFGGSVVLNMARAGEDLDAVVSFHGGPATDTPVAPGIINGRLLVLHGEADEFVPAAQLDAFREEMTKAGVRFDVRTYPGAKHGFTNPNAAEHGMPQLAYDQTAADQSWQAMLDLFAEVFGSAG